MADLSNLYQQNLLMGPLSAEQRNLLMNAWLSNNPPHKQQQQHQQHQQQQTQGSSSTSAQAPPTSVPVSHSRSGSSNGIGAGASGGGGGGYFESPVPDAPGSGHLGFASDESPFLDFDPEADFDFNSNVASMIGDLPEFEQQSNFEPQPKTETANGNEHEPGDKRKSMDGREGEQQPDSGKKQRQGEGQEKVPKKPGRKPLTNEPTSKRKAQNRAAQRAFRERKEKHLRDLEAKVEELEKVSRSANQENTMLRAQVERLQAEVREYRKRLSWISRESSFSALSALQSVNTRNLSGLNNDFVFDFPRFGELSTNQISSNGTGIKPTARAQSISNDSSSSVRASASPSSRDHNNTLANGHHQNSVDSSFVGGYHHQTGTSSYSASNTGSPSTSSESQNAHISSQGTSPEPAYSPPKTNGTENEQRSDYCGKIDGKSFCEKLNMACGNVRDPVPAILKKSHSARPSVSEGHQRSQSQLPTSPTSPATSQAQTSTSTPGQTQSLVDPTFSLDWLTQQNGGNFDPVLFNDYREPQDAVLSQDFGNFFDDVFPFPDLTGSPFSNSNVDYSAQTQTQGQGQAHKKDLVAEIDKKLDEDEEVVPGEDASEMLTCTKIWDRLQSNEKFRNGEIDVDSLCSELRTKARCSEEGVVIKEKDVEEVMGWAGITR